MRHNKSVSTVITERQQQLDAVLQEVSGLESVMDRIKNLHQQLLKKKDNTEGLYWLSGAFHPLFLFAVSGKLNTCCPRQSWLAYC